MEMPGRISLLLLLYPDDLVQVQYRPYSGTMFPSSSSHHAMNVPFNGMLYIRLQIIPLHS